MLMHASLLLLGVVSAAASSLFISDYSGNVTAVRLTGDLATGYQLNQIGAKYHECGVNPSWLTIDSGRGILYCLDEGFSTPSGLSSFSIKKNGQLKLIQNYTITNSIFNGSVSAVIVGEPTEQQALVVANYGGGSVSSLLLGGNGGFDTQNVQTISFDNSQHGPNKDRQNSSHPHQAIVDPTGNYILMPDLGLDRVHVFFWDTGTSKLKQLTDLVAPSGCGPRHAVFWNPSDPLGAACDACTTHFYLVCELNQQVLSYSVAYSPGGYLDFTMFDSMLTTGPYYQDKPFSTPAEIVISPDNRFLTISNRNDTNFLLGFNTFSDSLSTFEILSNGKLAFRQLWPTFGHIPRHFSMNKLGNLVAVGNSESQEMVILRRDVASGMIGDKVASFSTGFMVGEMRFGNVTNVAWA